MPKLLDLSSRPRISSYRHVNRIIGGGCGKGISLPIRDEFWHYVFMLECGTETLTDEKFAES